MSWKRTYGHSDRSSQRGSSFVPPLRAAADERSTPDDELASPAASKGNRDPDRLVHLDVVRNTTVEFFLLRVFTADASGKDDPLIFEVVSWSQPDAVSSSHGEPESLSETLTGAEAGVLRYLPTNLTVSEIAGELDVTVNTVKTHVRHIYLKLGAHRRSEAVERARALGLLRSTAQHRSTVLARRGSRRHLRLVR